MKKSCRTLRSCGPATTLNEQYINTLASDEQKEIAHQINRRTEFRVLRTDYIPAK